MASQMIFLKYNNYCVSLLFKALLINFERFIYFNILTYINFNILGIFITFKHGSCMQFAFARVIVFLVFLFSAVKELFPLGNFF